MGIDVYEKPLDADPEERVQLIAPDACDVNLNRKWDYFVELVQMTIPISVTNILTFLGFIVTMFFVSWSYPNDSSTFSGVGLALMFLTLTRSFYFGLNLATLTFVQMRMVPKTMLKLGIPSNGRF